MSETILRKIRSQVTQDRNDIHLRMLIYSKNPELYAGISVNHMVFFFSRRFWCRNKFCCLDRSHTKSKLDNFYFLWLNIEFWRNSPQNDRANCRQILYDLIWLRSVSNDVIHALIVWKVVNCDELQKLLIPNTKYSKQIQHR